MRRWLDRFRACGLRMAGLASGFKDRTNFLCAQDDDAKQKHTSKNSGEGIVPFRFWRSLKTTGAANGGSLQRTAGAGIQRAGSRSELRVEILRGSRRLP